MVGCRRNFLKGLGGPGAPHAFFFDRREDLAGWVVGISNVTPGPWFKWRQFLKVWRHCVRLDLVSPTPRTFSTMG